MAKNKKKNRWFKSVRGSYLPNNWKGALTYIPYVGYLVASSIIIMNIKVSYVFRIISLVCIWIVGALVMTLIANRLST